MHGQARTHISLGGHCLCFEDHKLQTRSIHSLTRYTLRHHHTSIFSEIVMDTCLRISFEQLNVVCNQLLSCRALLTHLTRNLCFSPLIYIQCVHAWPTLHTVFLPSSMSIFVALINLPSVLHNLVTYSAIK